MKKIDISSIVFRHYKSVLTRSNGRWSIGSIAVFFVMPLALATLLVLGGVSITDGALNASLTIYSIFAALLLSVQVALFGIVQRDILASGAKNRASADTRAEVRRSLVRELNVNISFLIIFSIIILCILMAFILINIPNRLESFTTSFCFIHFALSAIMSVKRAFILFDQEYA